MADKAPASPPAQESDESKADSKLASFLKAAGAYKEFVALVVFFLGGVFWAFAYFATKQQLKEVQCIMNANMAFVQSRMDSASLSQLMLDNLRESAALDKASPSPENTLKRNQLKTGAADIARKLAEADNAAAQALNKLKFGECLSD
jgi:hypothetical protein